MDFYPKNIGILEAIIGPMCSGKSDALVEKCLKLEVFGKKKVKVYKPIIDNRFEDDFVVSRTGGKYPSTNLDIEITTDIIKQVVEETKDYDVVGFDEVQFFSKKIIDLVSELVYQKKIVIVAGLNLDYRGKEFKYIGGLLAQADEVYVKRAYCNCCGEPAKYSQRLLEGKPAPLGETILVGSSESYEPRCGNCYIPPNKVKKS